MQGTKKLHSCHVLQIMQTVLATHLALLSHRVLVRSRVQEAGVGVTTEAVPPAAWASSFTDDTWNQVPSKLCFHRVTMWSPEDTASTFPVTDHDTLQTGAPKL
mmetsp:Transcript_21171/g.30696  ORF Transcript_21171/g.30696 Transcript_21171/m.30696 type:complete len:103 (-) Transcript_21171:872-1180(-)